jgi:hypothetical protein
MPLHVVPCRGLFSVTRAGLCQLFGPFVLHHSRGCEQVC